MTKCFHCSIAAVNNGLFQNFPQLPSNWPVCPPSLKDCPADIQLLKTANSKHSDIAESTSIFKSDNMPRLCSYYFQKNMEMRSTRLLTETQKSLKECSKLHRRIQTTKLSYDKNSEYNLGEIGCTNQTRRDVWKWTFQNMWNQEHIPPSTWSFRPQTDFCQLESPSQFPETMKWVTRPSQEASRGNRLLRRDKQPLGNPRPKVMAGSSQYITTQNRVPITKSPIVAS